MTTSVRATWTVLGDTGEMAAPVAEAESDDADERRHRWRRQQQSTATRRTGATKKPEGSCTDREQER